MRRVAPELHAVLWLRDQRPDVDPETTTKARAELQALLAVARAAKAHCRSPAPCAYCNKRLTQALARLDRASGGKG